MEKVRLEYVCNASRRNIENRTTRYRNARYGPPKATPTMSVHELEVAGMVGVYREVGDAEFTQLRSDMEDIAALSRTMKKS